MLASGVWRLWLTPRRKSSLAASSSRSCCVLGLDPGEQLGVAHRDRDLAREQLQEVLVGALPAARRRQVADDDAELLAAGAQARPEGPRTRRARGPRSGSSPGRRVGSPRRSSRTRLGRRARRGRRAGRCRRAARRLRSRRGSGPARGCGARGPRPGGCGSRRAGRARRRRRPRSACVRSPADDAVHGRRDRPERGGQVGRQEVRDEHGEQRPRSRSRTGGRGRRRVAVRPDARRTAAARSRSRPGAGPGGAATRAQRQRGRPERQRQSAESRRARPGGSLRWRGRSRHRRCSEVVRPGVDPPASVRPLRLGRVSQRVGDGWPSGRRRPAGSRRRAS